MKRSAEFKAEVRLMRTGIANLPLHYGKVPPWLFQKMTDLAREITLVIIAESGPNGMLEKLSDPFWFQAFGCVLGYDWHSSGLTTTVCGALKEGLRSLERDTGLFVAGGKGRTSRKTPVEIENKGNLLSKNPSKLIYASKMVAKVDSSALQDGYQLYHHCFIFTSKGSWAVVQQGMKEEERYARRYHWLSKDLKDFVCEPHKAICSDSRGRVLNMVASEGREARATVAELSHEKPSRLISDLKRMQNLSLPRAHSLRLRDINPDRLQKIFLKTYERQPQNFCELLGIRGVGPKTIRALSLISELVYGVKSSYRDPARFSFAHGGKDGIPYPVDRKNYDRSIKILRKILSQAKIGKSEKLKAFRRLEKIS